MIDLNVNVPTFEQFLVEEDTASLSHKGHAIKNGDQTADKVDGDLPGGSSATDPVEKSNDAAPGDGSGEDLPKPPQS